EPVLLVVVIDDLQEAVDDGAGVHQSRSAGMALAGDQAAHGGHFQANPVVVLDVGQEVALPGAGVQVDDVAAFVDVNQRDDVGPSVGAYRSHVGHRLLLEKFAGFVQRHVAAPGAAPEGRLGFAGHKFSPPSACDLELPPY